MKAKIEIININCTPNPHTFGSRMHFFIKFRCFEGVAGYVEWALTYKGLPDSDGYDQPLTKLYVLPLKPMMYNLELYGEPVDFNKLPPGDWSTGVVVLTAAYNGQEFQRYSYKCRNGFLLHPQYQTSELHRQLNLSPITIANREINWHKSPLKISIVADVVKPFNAPDPDSPLSPFFADKDYQNCNGKVIVKFPNEETVAITTVHPPNDNRNEISSLDVFQYAHYSQGVRPPGMAGPSGMSGPSGMAGSSGMAGVPGMAGRSGLAGRSAMASPFGTAFSANNIFPTEAGDEILPIPLPPYPGTAGNSGRHEQRFFVPSIFELLRRAT